MSLSERLGLAALRRLDPERAHGLALRALRAGLVPLPGPVTSSRLRTTLAGMTLSNPIGLAAGFDKNAEAVRPLARTGFGFLEVGAATPRPQEGNPRPRLYRLTEDHAAINRFGFNNAGIEVIARRLERTRSAVPRGLNLGANKDSPDRAADFAAVLRRAAPFIDFATVNVSSPNTEKLRDLQGAEALRGLLNGVMEANERGLPIFLKIAPDLDDQALADIAGVATEVGIAGIVATNTTLSREGLRSPYRDQTGGLSGAPLFERSTRVLAKLSALSPLPLIGVGGVSSAAEAYAKIRAGASAVQLYTAMVYHGVAIAAQIARELDDLLLQDGLITAQAVGLDRDRWT
ncbi:quinone-dependent dihydroorotate dehydrogenase [Palleronia sp.]|uniref:quinone-dependent dihydroorotate dehydrogenase n=1 Tax=Palleronia sp. TaxID=1940284 RepID=UPI0035C83E0E